MRNALSWAVLGVAAAALAPLAWLQYQWIGRVGEAQREQMRHSLAVAAAGFRIEFDTLIARTVEAMAAPPREGPPPPDPELVAGCWVTLAGGVFRLDPSTFKLEPAAWPERLERLRARLDGPLPAVDYDLPAVALPHRPPRERPPGPPPPARGPTVIQFNLDYLRAAVLPQLAARFFPRDYHVRVANGASVIFDSAPDLPADYFDRPDAFEPLFAFAAPRPPQRPALPHHRPLAGGAWRLLVRSSAGSLDAVVAETRRRNLTVSFAVLLVLASSLAVLMATTHRAQRLAAQQLEFVAGVSHELRTPLTVISSAADNLADGFVNNEAQARRYGSLIRAESGRLARMVEQVLGFAGIQSGRARYDLEPVEVGPVIERAAASCGGAPVRLAPDLPLVLADSVALQHCLRNLVENAMVHGGEAVSVSARAVSGSVEIAVEDRGPGIPPADLPHIFEPFYRGGRARRDQARGFGLGLALAKRIVEAHSGEISAESPAGKGARFTVRLPAWKEQDVRTQDSADRG